MSCRELVKFNPQSKRTSGFTTHLNICANRANYLQILGASSSPFLHLARFERTMKAVTDTKISNASACENFLFMTLRLA